MEDASALYAAQCCARRINTVRKAIRLCGADHEQITITALLSSAWGSRCSTLRGDGEAGLHLGVSSTSVLLDGVPLQKPPTNRSFAPRVHFWLATDRIFERDRLGARDRLARQRFADPAAVSAHRAGGLQSFAVIFVSFGKLVTPFFSRHRESKKGRTSEIVKRLLRTEGLAFPFGTEGWLM